ncbi:UNVERIFIED_CONTAM: hypothetical protein PYX00_007893 [Menopon gallinae]|uniref:Tektin n=1 Tax=Menopon gallinae TaxID=328185 RepID=A0AAW2HL18_9NEOP
MAVNSISMAEKPVPHMSEADWRGRVWNLRAVAETKTFNSYELRNMDRETRNEAVITRRWANYHTNLRLTDRMTEVRRWLNIMAGALENLKHESKLLMDEKFETEKEIEKFCHYVNILGECRVLRDSKHKLNLVNDMVNYEFQQELKTLEITKKYLSQKCFSAWEENNRLNELIGKLENDIADKMETLEIEGEALRLDNTSVAATYKPDVLRQPATITPYETWLEMVHFNQLTADNECATAAKLRESVALAREKCKTDYLAQYEATNYQLRKTIYETNRLKLDLEFQRSNILDEMEKLNREIDSIMKCREETVQYLKCAESRLEMRNQRPTAEKTKDAPHMGLFEEVMQLQDTLRDLNSRIADSKTTFNQMESYLLELETEIKYKEQSIKIDEEALEAHKTLIVPVPVSQVDKTIELLNMEKSLPPEGPVLQ